MEKRRVTFSEETEADENLLQEFYELYGLEPIYKYDDIMSFFAKSQIKVNNFLSFEELLQLNIWKPKKNSREMNDNEISLNNLYTTFIFRKKIN